VDEEVREIPTPETVAARDAWLALPEKERKGAAPELEMVPSIIQTLNIEGISFAEQRERRIQLVLDFWQNLVSHQSTTERGGDRAFMNHFNGLPFIDYNETQDVAGVEINAFKLVLRTVDLASLGQHS
jgi:hypothetical protein